MAGVLDELAALAWTRPGPGATAAVTARWYLSKAEMLDHAGTDGGLDPVLAARWARDARRHATRLVGDTAELCKRWAA